MSQPTLDWFLTSCIHWAMIIVLAVGLSAIATFFDPRLNLFTVVGLALMWMGIFGLIKTIAQRFGSPKPPVKPA